MTDARQPELFARMIAESFAPLGWFAPVPQDGLSEDAKSVVLIGNVGPAMFQRFVRERDPRRDSLDDWTRQTVDRLARALGAGAIYPFDAPAHPFLRWGQRAGAGQGSPLGLNIHPVFGLWHAYRAALLFPTVLELPTPVDAAHPCDTCVDKPCLTGCPVSAFDGVGYNVAGCVQHLSREAGHACLSGGCLARRACPVGREFAYMPRQAQFHTRAFFRSQGGKG